MWLNNKNGAGSDLIFFSRDVYSARAGCSNDEISGFPVYKALLCEVVKKKDGSKADQKSVSAKVCLRDNLFAFGKKHQKPDTYVYLDNNATSAVSDEVREAMMPFLNENYGNPSAIHGIGRFICWCAMVKVCF